jgi:hypothetical protein
MWDEVRFSLQVVTCTFCFCFFVFLLRECGKVLTSKAVRLLRILLR